jgi:hypothetical protein
MQQFINTAQQSFHFFNPAAAAPPGQDAPSGSLPQMLASASLLQQPLHQLMQLGQGAFHTQQPLTAAGIGTGGGHHTASQQLQLLQATRDAIQGLAGGRAHTPSTALMTQGGGQNISGQDGQHNHNHHRHTSTSEPGSPGARHHHRHHTHHHHTHQHHHHQHHRRQQQQQQASKPELQAQANAYAAPSASLVSCLSEPSTGTRKKGTQQKHAAVTSRQTVQGDTAGAGAGARGGGGNGGEQRASSQSTGGGGGRGGGSTAQLPRRSLGSGRAFPAGLLPDVADPAPQPETGGPGAFLGSALEDYLFQLQQARGGGFGAALPPLDPRLAQLVGQPLPANPTIYHAAAAGLPADPSGRLPANLGLSLGGHFAPRGALGPLGATVGASGGPAGTISVEAWLQSLRGSLDLGEGGS